MTIFVALLLISIGIILDAIHNYIRRSSEYQAFKDGYAQAMKEEKIKKDAEKNKLLQESFQRPLNNSMFTPNYKPYTTAYAPSNQSNQNNPNKTNIPESFMDDLHRNGRAIVRIQ